MLIEMDISSLVDSRHYLLFKVMFAEKPIAFQQKLLHMYFDSVLLKGKEGDQIDENKILNPIPLLRQLCKILPQSHKRIQALWISLP